MVGPYLDWHSRELPRSAAHRCPHNANMAALIRDLFGSANFSRAFLRASRLSNAAISVARAGESACQRARHSRRHAGDHVGFSEFAVAMEQWFKWLPVETQPPKPMDWLPRSLDR